MKSLTEKKERTKYLPRLLKEYWERIISTLMKKFGYKNPMQVPRLKKIVINVAVGEAIAEPKILDIISEDLSLVTGQRPTVVRAKRSVSAFKLKKGIPIACKVTLRGYRMYEFLDRFLNFAAPRIRDFRGFDPNSFDTCGNYTLGISEQVIFPEIDVSKVKKIFGMDIAIVTTAKKDDEAKALLEELGIVFKKQ